jgi:hypothetical protein
MYWSLGWQVNSTNPPYKDQLGFIQAADHLRFGQFDGMMQFLWLFGKCLLL